MSYRSTPDNKYFGANFISVGGVEAKISMSQNTEKRLEEVHFRDIDISTCTPPMDMKLVPKCLFSGVLRYDIEFYLRGGVQKKSENQNLPPLF